MTFLDYYRENLAHIRNLASEFSAEFPKIAARLELSDFECQDPYVERLLEGTAFLAARVEKKLESGFPRLLESIFASVAPLALYPIPSFCVLELQCSGLDERLKNGSLLPRGAAFHCSVPGIQTRCTYTTMTDISLYPLTLTGVEYCTRDLEQFHFSIPNVQAALSLQISRSDGGPVSESAPDELSFFLNLPESEASLLQGQLIVDLAGVYAGNGDVYAECPEVEVDLPMFRNHSSNLFSRVRALSGLQVLQRFMAYPAAFKFFRVKGLKQLFRRTGGNSLKLVFALKRRETAFIHTLDRDHFRLWCVPAVNLFRRNSDRGEVNGQYEYHVVPDRTAPLDYEIFKVLSTETYNERNETLFQCCECYDETGRDGRAHHDFFSVHRRERLVNDSRNARSSYAGTEVFLSFSGDNWRSRWEEVRQFRAELLCTNRDLPLLIRYDSRLEAPADSVVKSAVFIASPSRPRNALISGGTKEDWKKVGHIVFNLSSALWLPGEIPVGILKDLIRAYSIRNEEETERMVEGIAGIRTEPKMFRFIHKGCVFYENGWQMHLTLSEQQYAGTGYFIFAAVLRALLDSYTPLNSCVELIVHTDKRADVVTWNIQEK